MDHLVEDTLSKDDSVESFHYENCIVAFLDILGFKKKVMQSEKDDGVIKMLVDSLKIGAGFKKREKKGILCIIFA